MAGNENLAGAPAPTVIGNFTRDWLGQPAPIPTAAPTRITVGRGSDTATDFAVAEGSLGVSVAEHIGNNNRFLDQDQYPISDKPSKTSDQVHEVKPGGCGDGGTLSLSPPPV